MTKNNLSKSTTNDITLKLIGIYQMTPN